MTFLITVWGYYCAAARSIKLSVAYIRPILAIRLNQLSIGVFPYDIYRSEFETGSHTLGTVWVDFVGDSFEVGYYIRDDSNNT